MALTHTIVATSTVTLLLILVIILDIIHRNALLLVVCFIATSVFVRSLAIMSVRKLNDSLATGAAYAAVSWS
jgi:hypothetical protein